MAEFSGADLRGTDLRNADLSSQSLSGTDLRFGKLGQDVVGADLRGADLREAEMSFTDLRGVDLRYADLRKAEMGLVDLWGADLRGADTRGALLSDIDPLGIREYPDKYLEASEQAAGRETAREGTKEAMIENLVYVIVNQHRAENGIHTVERLWEVDVTAWSHSEDMAERGYFSHNTPEGLTPADRASVSWYGCASENLWHLPDGGYEFSAEQLANMVVDSWMSSPGHRQNLLNIGHIHTGIGVALGDGGSVYATQLFC